MSMNILIVTAQSGNRKGLYVVTSGMEEKIKSLDSGIKIEQADNDDPKLDSKLKSADILIASDPDFLTQKKCENLKWIHTTSAGVNKFPEFISNSKILITNSSGVHPIPIAEHVFGLMLMLVRKINLAHRAQIEKKEWFKSYEYYFPGELFGKKLLIVGMGKIGERIGEIGQAFGMEVFGIVRDLKKKRATKIKLFALENLEKLVGQSDFVVSVLPGTPATRGIFDLTLFKKFKKGSYFFNVGRGTTVVENDLVKSLKTGVIAGAGLDVFEVEPLPKNSEFWKLENVILTPHYSGWSPRYTERMIDIFIENLKAYLKGKPMPSLVDKKLGY